MAPVPTRSVLLLQLTTLALSVCCLDYPAATFHFPEFPYKESAKNEAWFREQEAACEESSACAAMVDSRIARTRCARQCLSPSCYEDIYEADELEEGEIDVRLNSFKGCFIQRSARMRP
ncbi:uncharacterized protein LOC124165998 [Ischnura elegans]|uniref:uncharacterized protein LOC124165998 n=1 Tax=Ischnura elegans TaxID=197161 RepID=UPI001ED8B12F|nr:uncharacterized protein LOC124165998 [Ischnura elegans]